MSEMQRHVTASAASAATVAASAAAAVAMRGSVCALSDFQRLLLFLD